MGIPFYGKEYNASDINQPFTGSDVAKLYNEYHGLINNGWEYVWDSDGQVPYLKSDTQNKIITIDDSLSVSKKSSYAISNNLGGLMIWALGYDYVDGDQKLNDGRIIVNRRCCKVAPTMPFSITPPLSPWRRPRIRPTLVINVSH